MEAAEAGDQEQAMDYQEIFDTVLGITKRPDLGPETESAIRSAILKAHHSDFYYRDIVEVAIEFDKARYVQTFDPRQVVPRFRKAKYIRHWFGEGDGCYGPFLEPIQIEGSMDAYGISKENVFYMAGQYLQIRARPAIEKVLFGCYVNPPIGGSGEEICTSWIAADFPYAIIYEAARQIFLITNFQEQSASMQRLVAEEYAALGLSNVDTVPT